MNVLVINARYIGGGAEKVARQVFFSNCSNDITMYFYEGEKTISGRVANNQIFYGHRTGAKKNPFRRFISILTNNSKKRDLITRFKLLCIIKKYKIDVISLHNAHGNYIGIKDIAFLARKTKIIWTLHDMWAFTGHCAYSIDCDKWENGCHRCPNLKLYPSMKIDLASQRYLLKKESFVNDNIHLVVPSMWLYKNVKRSFMKELPMTLINNGVGLDEFRYLDKNQIRMEEGIPERKIVCLFMANDVKSDYKGSMVFIDALEKIENKSNYLFIIAGKASHSITNKEIDIRYLDYISDSNALNRTYAMADVFILPSIAENFPCSILESFASGTAVIASNVGGVAELIDENKGWLFEKGNSNELATIIDQLPNRKELHEMGKVCRKVVEEKYSLTQMEMKYQELFKSMVPIK